jgi:soluble lytic murein transglycosylase-like protein
MIGWGARWVTHALFPLRTHAAPEAEPPALSANDNVSAEAALHLEQLASVVARRYQVAQDAALEVVRAAIREGERYELDPVLILAVIAVESRFNPVAASHKGAIGLMQVIPRYHPEKIAALGASSILVPDVNIALGARILNEAIRRGGSDMVGLQLYNGAADDPTQAYANRVLAERKRIEGALAQRRDSAPPAAAPPSVEARERAGSAVAA